MAFLISSKTLGSQIGLSENSEIREIGSFNVIEEEMKSSTSEETHILVKGNIYGEEGQKMVEEIQRINENLLERVDGSFTAINIKKDELKLFRDYFGSRPVYFLEKDGDVFISDRIKSLLNFTEPRPEREVCLDYLHSGLVDHKRETFFQDINQLRPGESLSYSHEGLEVKELDQEEEKVVNDDLESLFKESINERMPEKDFVCPVSGGLDSTILASKSLGRDADFVHSNFNVDTGDEEYFELVNEKLSLNAEKISISTSELMREIRQSMGVFEQPTSMIAIQAQNIMFREINDSIGASTILDGTGADEIFYGYPRFVPYYIARELKKNPLKGLKALKQYSYSLSGYTWKELFRVITGNTYSNCNNMPEIDHEPTFNRPKSLHVAGESNLEDYNFPHILYSLDKSREEYGHKIRLGFLSSHLKKKISREPQKNFEGGLTKYLLRNSFRDDIPDRVFARKKKTGFIELKASDVDGKIRAEFKKVFSSDNFRDRELFDGELFYRRFERGRQDFFKCYRFYCFECWMRSFID